MSRENSFQVPSDLDEVAGARDRFEVACREDGLVDHELEAWKLVFTELLCNAIEHGANAPSDLIDVRYSVSDERIELVMVDPGDCDPELRQMFDRTETDFAETGRGAGLILVRTFTDEIEVRALDDGTLIRVMKRREVANGRGGAPE